MHSAVFTANCMCAQTKIQRVPQVRVLLVPLGNCGQFWIGGAAPFCRRALCCLSSYHLATGIRVHSAQTGRRIEEQCRQG